MPVWHKSTRQLVEERRLVLLGVTQEQHPERCELFAQWQQFDWPILHDPINAFEVLAVPIPIAIDEHGIIRSTRPRPDTFEEDFINRKFADDEGAALMPLPSPALGATYGPDELAALASRARATKSAVDWRALGDALVIWSGAKGVEDAIDAYRRALETEPENGNTLFRLGVCYRMRHETPRRQPSDFQLAIDFWGRALDTDPNQYIWRRRIQQYGPRLDKPYPFYDWVEGAKRQVASRGEQPVDLPVEPYGAELARPIRRFAIADDESTSPDPEGRIDRDNQRLIETEVTVVPPRVRPGETARVHVTFHPNEALKAFWNNESEPLRLWVDVPEGCQVAEPLLSAPQGEQAETNEIRQLDFEIKVPEVAGDSLRLDTYALYYVCEDIEGVCRFLRQDVGVEIPLAAAGR